MEKKTEDLLCEICMIDNKTGMRRGVYVTEECSELIKELMKLERGKGEISKITEEGCDVLVTVYSLLLSFGVSFEDIDKMIQLKAERAVLRYLNNGEK